MHKKKKYKRLKYVSYNYYGLIITLILTPVIIS